MKLLKKLKSFFIKKDTKNVSVEEEKYELITDVSSQPLTLDVKENGGDSNVKDDNTKKHKKTSTKSTPKSSVEPKKTPKKTTKKTSTKSTPKSSVEPKKTTKKTKK